MSAVQRSVHVNKALSVYSYLMLYVQYQQHMWSGSFRSAWPVCQFICDSHSHWIPKSLIMSVSEYEDNHSYICSWTNRRWVDIKPVCLKTRLEIRLLDRVLVLVLVLVLVWQMIHTSCISTERALSQGLGSPYHLNISNTAVCLTHSIRIILNQSHWHVKLCQTISEGLSEMMRYW